MQTKHFVLGLSVALALAGAVTLFGQDKPAASADFNSIADKALAAMKAQAGALNIKGAAIVAYSPGDTVEGWSSKMTSVGWLTSPPSSNSPTGEDNLAIAYTKASEMAVTLRNSGSLGRAKMKGENGWQGGVMTKSKTGYVFAAFSGGVSADDVKVSKAGLAVLSDAL